MSSAEIENIPNSWELVPLSDVCTVVTDGTHKTPNYVSSGIRFISIKNIRPFSPVNWSNYEKYITPDEHAVLIKRCKPEFEDILFPRIGTLGFAKRIDFNEEVSIFVGLGLAKPIRELILSKYLEYWMNHPLIYTLSHERANGSGRLTLPLEESRQLPVVLAPLAEQNRIVAKLEELLSDLDAGVAELKAAQRKLQHYRQSLLKAAVEGALTASWRETQRAANTPLETGVQLLELILRERRARWEEKQLAKFKEQGKTPPKGWQKKYPEPGAPDTTGLPALPDGWVWSSLDALISDGPQNGLYLSADNYGQGTPILRIDDFQIGWHRDRADLKCVDAGEQELLAYSLRAGDLVINRVNSMTHLGKSLLIPESLSGTLYESNMMRLNLSDSISGLFVEYYLGSDIGRARLTQDAKWAVNQASINQQDVRRTPVPLPPLTEQFAIGELLVSQMTIAVSLDDAIKLGSKQSTAQRQNILRAAFAGQLVPQDPNDEPASVLLDRIRSERAAQAATKKPRVRKTEKAAA